MRHYTSFFLNIETNINYLTGRFEAAIASGRKHLDRTQEGVIARSTWKLVIASYIELGRESEAQAEAENYLAHNPDYSVNDEAGWVVELYKDSSWVDRYMDTLRTAGLPE